MKFFEITKKFLKEKTSPKKNYQTNPFVDNKNVTLVWIEPKTSDHWSDSS